MENIRAKIKRRFSHKDPNPNYDDHDEADEETQTHLENELNNTDDRHPHGKPGSLLNRLILHGNKKTEDDIAAGNTAAQGSR